MARRKRSLRGLGGTATHHFREARLDLKNAESRLTQAYQSAQKGRCQHAFDMFTKGVGDHGRVVVNYENSGPNPQASMRVQIDDVGRAYDEAFHAIAKKCLIKTKL